MRPEIKTIFQSAVFAAVSLCLTSGSVSAEPAGGKNPSGSKVFSHPERIRYDGHCMTIEGKDTFIYSATFHYFRTPKELWRDRFQKIKAAGFNTVET
jgi:hypothetical protein